MRQIGTLPDQARAERFADWLASQGIRAEVDPEPSSDAGGWLIWVHDEDRVAVAGEHLAAFESDPEAERYLVVEGLVRKQQEQARAAERRRPNRPIATWSRPPLARCRLTVGLIVISVIVTLLSIRSLGNGLFGEFDTRAEPVMGRLSIVPIFEVEGKQQAERYTVSDTLEAVADSVSGRRPLQIPNWGFGRVLHGQVWRLVTPIFIHFQILHILFNMLWLRELGSVIEYRRGWWRLLALVLITAVLSNVGQFWLVADESPFFGGMSGVVYGLFGYIWTKGRFDPAAGLSLPPSTVVWMIGWFVLCWTGVVDNIANHAHGVGLVSGMLLGMLPAIGRRG